jgi:FkbM family methyltransferase
VPCRAITAGPYETICIMTFVSYAQNFEDVLLWRALQDVEGGRYLDVGAHDPTADSVSLSFYLAGWRGIHIEPTAAYAERLRAARPDEIVIEAAVSSSPGPINFYEFPDTGLSTGDADVAESHRKIGYESRLISVPCVRLESLFELADGDIHWMKIDVEGLEADVLRSWGQCPQRPWVVVVEATFPMSQRVSSQLWEDELKRRDYREVHFDGLNRYYLHQNRQELADHFAIPPNVFDFFNITAAHFCAGQIVRDYESRLESSTAATGVATAERDDALNHAGAVHRRFEAAENQYKESLALASAERERLLVNASAMVDRLVESERRSREGVDQLWREHSLATTALHRLHQKDRDCLLTALEDARSSAALAAVDMARDHSREVRRLEDDLLSTTERLISQHRHEEGQLRAALASELDLERERATQDRQADRLIITALQNSLADFQEGAAHAEREAKSKVRDLAAARDKEQAEAAQARINAQQARSEVYSVRAQAAKRLSELRLVMERAQTLIEAAISEPPQRWQRIGQALGFARPSPSLRNLRSWSMSVAETSEGIRYTLHKNGELMESLALPEGRHAHVPATSINELLCRHDMDFVRCAYVTLLGREPDPTGQAYYAERLRVGLAKMQILSELRLSKEGRERPQAFPKMDLELAKAARTRFPIIGRLLPGSRLEPNRSVRAFVAAVTHQLGSFERQVLSLVQQQQIALSRDSDIVVTNPPVVPNELPAAATEHHQQTTNMSRQAQTIYATLLNATTGVGAQ